MTEAGVICSNPYEEESRKPGSVGFPLPGNEIRIEDGVLQLRGPNVFKGVLCMF